MKLSLDFVRTLPKNDAKTEFSSSLSTNLTDRFWTWVISGLTRFKLDFRPIYRRSSYKGQKWIKSGRSKVFQTDHTERTDVCQKDHPDCNLMTVHFLIYLVPVHVSSTFYHWPFTLNSLIFTYIILVWVRFLSSWIEIRRLPENAHEFWHFRNVPGTIFYGNVREIGPSINTN